jgi:FAD:protein FMN transferase
MTTPSDRGAHRVEHVMGTAVSFDVRDPDCSPEAIDRAVEWLHHVDETFSTHRPDSPISALGRGEIALDEAGPEIAGVLRRCEEIRHASDGAFDVFEVPAPNGTTLDPSGLVKGWAIERAAAIIEEHGGHDFVINAGGDIVLRGRPWPGEPWRVGIRHPDEPMAVALTVEAEGPLGVATSATYERGAHIVDPRTGRPPTTLLSATVLGPDLGLADAYAKVVFVLGLAGLAWIERQPCYETWVITVDELTYWTSGITRTANGSAVLNRPVEPAGAG